jgi:hypothetical protein
MRLPKIFDRLSPFNENPTCFRCKSRMNVDSASRLELRYQCPICGLRQTYTTLNNHRMLKFLNTTFFLVAVAWAVGVLTSVWTFFRDFISGGNWNMHQLAFQYTWLVLGVSLVIVSVYWSLWR